MKCSSYIAVMLVTLIGGCAHDTAFRPAETPAPIPAGFLRPRSTAVELSAYSPDSSPEFAVLGAGRPCSHLSSTACSYNEVSLEDGNSTFSAYAGTFFLEEWMGAVYQLGGVSITRGGIPGFGGNLSCGALALRQAECGTSEFLFATCGREKNVANSWVRHYAVTIFGANYTQVTTDRAECGPANDEACGGSGSGGGGPEGFFSCAPGEGGGTGGGGGGNPSCHSEYAIIEISTDGGNTWTTWWEGWIEVCE